MLGFTILYKTIEKENCKPDEFFPLHYALIKLRNCTIEILKPNDASNINKNVRGIINHIGLNVVGIEEVVARLKKHGIVFNGEIGVNATLMNGYKGISFDGPNGESISLYEFNEYDFGIQNMK